MTTPSQEPLRRPDGLKVTFRKVKFPFESTGFDRHWHSQSPFISHFWSALSQAFGPGEKFFIDSVRALRSEIHDDALMEEMEQFVRQEAHHTIQHRKFNRMVAALGYDTGKMEARYAAPLDAVREKMDPMDMLRVTMALEHFTAGFAHQFFQNPEVGGAADPNVLALWSWHAAEEAEHKATAFDVYERLGGGYAMRVATLPVAWGLILAITLRNTFQMLREDGSFSFTDVFRGMRYLFGRKGLVTGLLPTFVDYFRRDFHPWEEDDSASIARWEAENSSYVVERDGERVAPARSTPPPAPLACEAQELELPVVSAA